MIKEEGIIKIFTDKLVKVAKWPNRREHFVVAWSTSANSGHEGDGVPQNIRLANLWEGFANNKIVE